VRVPATTSLEHFMSIKFLVPLCAAAALLVACNQRDDNAATDSDTATGTTGSTSDSAGGATGDTTGGTAGEAGATPGATTSPDTAAPPADTTTPPADTTTPSNPPPSGGG
jgi:outer membrane biosynthesis protein TonB